MENLPRNLSSRHSRWGQAFFSCVCSALGAETRGRTWSHTCSNWSKRVPAGKDSAPRPQRTAANLIALCAPSQFLISTY